ncbi:MAG: hypothetical protein WKF35_00045 [Ferruginibacter sp.]
MHAQKKIKAFILLLVFSLNTIAGLACAAGFNFQTKKNHEHSANASNKVHQHGNAKVHAHDHGDVSGHHSHDKAVPAHDHTTSLKHDTPAEEDCCSDEIVKLSLLDKAINKASQYNIPLHWGVVYLNSDFLYFTHTNAAVLARLKPPLLRSWPMASHTDIRIVIQSFQI